MNYFNLLKKFPILQYLHSDTRVKTSPPSDNITSFTCHLFIYFKVQVTFTYTTPHMRICCLQWCCHHRQGRHSAETAAAQTRSHGLWPVQSYTAII